MEKSYSCQTLTRFQAASPLANALCGGNNMDIWRAKWSQKPSAILQWSLCEVCENLLLDEKKIRKRSLAEAKI